MQFGDHDGIGSEVLLQHPLGVLHAKDGIIYIADSYNHKVIWSWLKTLRDFNCLGMQKVICIWHYLGSFVIFVLKIHGSSFQHICAFICAKNVVILIIINDRTSLNCFNLSFNFQIKKFDPATKRVTTIAGTGKAGFKDGKALTAQVRKWCKMYSISLYRNVKCLLRHKMLISFYRNLKCLLFRKM